MRIKDSAGLTLIELLISVAILGIIMAGLYQALGSALSTYDKANRKQDLLAQARYAMERMVMFVRETDAVVMPDGLGQETLQVSERVMDTHNNQTHAYVAGGDGTPDADNDADGLINEGGGDLPDLITFDLDKSDPQDLKLREEMPDYGTAALDDLAAKNVICGHVTAFACSRLSGNLVEIGLTLGAGNDQVSLKTRVIAGHVK